MSKRIRARAQCRTCGRVRWIPVVRLDREDWACPDCGGGEHYFRHMSRVLVWADLVADEPETERDDT